MPPWSACGCGVRRSHSRQPMDKHPAPLPRLLPGSQSESVPGQTSSAKSQKLLNVTNKPIITPQLLICNILQDKTQSVRQLLSCFYRTAVFSEAAMGQLLTKDCTYARTHAHSSHSISKFAEFNIQVNSLLCTDETSDKIFALPRKP